MPIIDHRPARRAVPGAALRSTLVALIRPVASLLGLTAGMWAVWAVVIHSVDAALGDLDRRVGAPQVSASIGRTPAPGDAAPARWR
jgi:hypothetical protein